MNEENKGFCRGVFFCCSLALAITALVIAGKYDGSDSDCDNDSFTIGLPIFLKVAGGVALSAIVLGVLPKEVALIIGVPVSLFDIVWAAIGLNIYANQMSSDCQNEAIGIMVLVWSIIQVCHSQTRTQIYLNIE